MLSIGVMSAGQGRYYLSLAQEDYYLHGGEPEGRWWGQGAEKLKLSGIVTGNQLHSLLSGISPSREPLVKNAGEVSRRPGFDLTFSAPKSVSVLWAVADDDLRRKLLDAHREAVFAALGLLEEEASYARTGKGGVNVHKAGLVVAYFEHGTSRALEPQLHAHALVMNVGVLADGRTNALIHPKLFNWKMVCGAAYRAEFSARLLDLGIETERDATSFRVVGVPQKLCDRLSARSKEIKEELGDLGLESARAAAVACKESRRIKEVVPPRAELFETWREVALGFRFTPQQVKHLIGRGVRPNESRAFSNAWDAAVKTLSEKRSHFSERDLKRAVFEEAQCRGLDIRSITERFAPAFKNSKHLVQLGIDDAGQKHATTKSAHSLEEQLRRDAKHLRRERTRGVSEKTVNGIIERYSTDRSPILEELRFHAKGIAAAAKNQDLVQPFDRRRVRDDARFVLTPEQANAVRHLTKKGRGGIRVLEGLAGAGKTTIFKVVREIYEKAGYTVIGVTLAGKAANQLQEETGIKTYTYAMLSAMMRNTFGRALEHELRMVGRAVFNKPRLPYDPFTFSKKTVLIIDEAAMLDTSQMADLIQKVRRAKGIVIPAGDRGQLPSIGPGGAFAYLADQLGKAVLKTILRQEEERDRNLVKAASEGKARTILDDLAERNLLTVASNTREAMQKLVMDWHDIDGAAPEDALIFVGTNAAAQEVNRLCQAARLSAGQLDKNKHIKISGTTFYKNDRVVLTRTDRKLGLFNGQTATIHRINSIGPLRSITLSLDDGSKVVVPLRDYTAIALGYAVTTHSGQGTTVERAYILAGGSMQDREMTYVQVSRAKKPIRVYVSKKEAGPDLSQLVRQIEQSRQQTLSIEQAERLRREAAKQLEQQVQISQSR